MLTTLRSARNSASETGPRMRRYLHHLLEHPVSRVPDQSDLLRSLLEHCDELTPLHVYTMRQLMGGAADAGYPAMPDRVRFEFPRDHRVQPDAQCGWHFLVGSLWDAEGNECGIEMMLFGIAMYPEPFAKDLGLSPIDNLALELPATDELVALATDPTPSPELAASNTAFVAAHQDDLNDIIARSSGLP